MNSNRRSHDDPRLTFIEIVALNHSIGVASISGEEDEVDGRPDAESDGTKRKDVERVSV